MRELFRAFLGIFLGLQFLVKYNVVAIVYNLVRHLQLQYIHPFIHLYWGLIGLSLSSPDHPARLRAPRHVDVLTLQQQHQRYKRGTLVTGDIKLTETLLLRAKMPRSTMIARVSDGEQAGYNAGQHQRDVTLMADGGLLLLQVCR